MRGRQYLLLSPVFSAHDGLFLSWAEPGFVTFASACCGPETMMLEQLRFTEPEAGAYG